ncbi:MAG: CpsD/CapB family tyrosine-protein kinase [bacterium]|nr:CpsD/CapB family tyrosine-protein kinase [bacterium]MDT8366127.1 CpsD/CapB family tyrosine-protein kinase [bacterium]
MGDHDLGKAVSETIKLYNLGGDSYESGGRVIANIDKKRIDERLVVYHRPRSMESEYFRFLKSRVEQEFGSGDKGAKGRVIMVTGPNLGAGKTTCAINLALAFARSHGGQTLFMDVDSRRAMSRKYLGIMEENLPGFTDVLNMKARAGQVLVNSGMFDMVYFPSGQFSESFLDHLSSQELAVLLDNLRRRFKYIIIDAPPAFPMPEAAVIAPHCDGVFIVLRAGRDGQGDLIQAQEALEGANIMGVILNAVKKTPGQRYGAYGYYGKR